MTGIPAGQGRGTDTPRTAAPIHVETVTAAEPSAPPVSQSPRTVDSSAPPESAEPQNRESREPVETVEIVDIPVNPTGNPRHEIIRSVPRRPVENPTPAAAPVSREAHLQPPTSPPSPSSPGKSPGIREPVEIVEVTSSSTTPSLHHTITPSSSTPSSSTPSFLSEVRRWVAEPASQSDAPASPAASAASATSTESAEPPGPTASSAPFEPPVQSTLTQPAPVHEEREFTLSIGSINVTVEEPADASHLPPPPPVQNRRSPSAGNEHVSSRLGRHYIRLRE